MSDSSTVLSAGAILNALQPILTAVATVVVSAAIPMAYALFSKWTGLKVQQSAIDQISAAAETEAGKAVAEAIDNLAGVKIDVKSPAVVAAVNAIGSRLPGVMAAAGVTPDAVAHMVAGEIGKLQARMAPLAAPSATPSPPGRSSSALQPPVFS